MLAKVSTLFINRTFNVHVSLVAILPVCSLRLPQYETYVHMGLKAIDETLNDDVYDSKG